jgi:RNA-directed DNA polymerase
VEENFSGRSFDWVLDIDVQSYFDSIDWEPLLKAVRHHTDCPWVLLAHWRFLHGNGRT